MKTTLFVCLGALSVAGYAVSEDRSASESSVPISVSTTARILDSISDGTSPTPAAPKLEYKVSSTDILQSATLREGGRNITIQRIKPIAFSSLPTVAEVPEEPSAELLQRIAEYRAAHPQSAM